MTKATHSHDWNRATCPPGCTAGPGPIEEEEAFWKPLLVLVAMAAAIVLGFLIVPS